MRINIKKLKNIVCYHLSYVNAINLILVLTKYDWSMHFSGRLSLHKNKSVFNSQKAITNSLNSINMPNIVGAY